MDHVLRDTPFPSSLISSDDGTADYLTTEHRQKIFELAETVPIIERKTLLANSTPISYLYFPISGLVSVVTDAPHQVEIGLIGRGGCVGVDALLGRDTTTGTKAIVRIRGTAWRVPIAHVSHLIEQDYSLLLSLLRYYRQFVADMATAHMASAVLTVPQRVARWIAINSARARSDVLPVSHGEIAEALAIRRAGVTNALHLLEGEQAIKAKRLSIQVLDRQRLIAWIGDRDLLPADIRGDRPTVH